MNEIHVKMLHQGQHESLKTFFEGRGFEEQVLTALNEIYQRGPQAPQASKEIIRRALLTSTSGEIDERLANDLVALDEITAA
jgi:hypothetical protein